MSCSSGLYSMWQGSGAISKCQNSFLNNWKHHLLLSNRRTNHVSFEANQTFSYIIVPTLREIDIVLIGMTDGGWCLGLRLWWYCFSADLSPFATFRRKSSCRFRSSRCRRRASLFGLPFAAWVIVPVQPRGSWASVNWICMTSHAKESTKGALGGLI